MSNGRKPRKWIILLLVELPLLPVVATYKSLDDQMLRLRPKFTTSVGFAIYDWSTRTIAGLVAGLVGIAIYGTILLVVLVYTPLPVGFAPYKDWLGEIREESAGIVLSVVFLVIVSCVSLVVLMDKVGDRVSFALGAIIAVTLGVLLLVILGGLGWGWLHALEMPGEAEHRIVHASIVTVERLDETDILGGADPLAVMPGDNLIYAVHPDGVLAVGRYGYDRERSPVFAEPIAGLSDVLVIPRREGDVVLAVKDAALVASDGRGGIANVAALPGPGYRFGQRVEGDGSLTSFLLFGPGPTNTSLLFGVTADGRHLKLADVDAPLTAATACGGHVVGATTNTAFVLRPGVAPRLLFKAPPGFGAIVSVLALLPEGSDAVARDCVYLFSTDDAIFAQQDGMTILLVAGGGGVLRAGRSRREVLVTDTKRHMVLAVSFADPRS